jgi:hypothetical protein
MAAESGADVHHRALRCLLGIIDAIKKPARKSRGKLVEYLYLDADQTVASLFAFEGGLIEEWLRNSEEESDKGGKIGGTVGYGPLKAEGNLGKNQMAQQEEQVLLKRTGYSRRSAARSLSQRLRWPSAFIPGAKEVLPRSPETTISSLGTKSTKIGSVTEVIVCSSPIASPLNKPPAPS